MTTAVGCTLLCALPPLLLPMDVDVDVLALTLPEKPCEATTDPALGPRCAIFCIGLHSAVSVKPKEPLHDPEVDELLLASQKLVPSRLEGAGYDFIDRTVRDALHRELQL